MTLPDWVSWQMEQYEAAKKQGELETAGKWLDIALVKLKSAKPSTVGQLTWAQQTITLLERNKEGIRALKTAVKVFGGKDSEQNKE